MDGCDDIQGVLSTEVKSFFDSAPPLKDYDHFSEKLKLFISQNFQRSGKNISYESFYISFLLCKDDWREEIVQESVRRK